MKDRLLIFVASACCFFLGHLSAYELQEGDIYFQSLHHSDLVDAIEGATKSPYSHCGILIHVDEEWFVLEAIGPVKLTPLREWIKNGRGERYDVYRLSTRFQDKIPDFIASAKAHMGKPYDILYQFDEDNIYCSELIFSAFKEVYDKELGKVRLLGELDWGPYETLIRSIAPSLPLDRPMITPKDLSEAEQLSLVYRGI